MKKNLSVVSLYLRSSVYRVLPIVAAMLLVQIAGFFILFKGAVSLEQLVLDAKFKWIFMGFGMAVFAVVLYNFYQLSKSQRARLLLLSKREIFFSEALAGSMIFALWFLTEALLVLCLSFVYTNMQDEIFITGQTAFLAFYRSDFLHFMLPLDDLVNLTKNILIVITMGFAVSFSTGGKENITAPQIITPVFVALGTVREMGNDWNIVSLVVLALLLAWLIFSGITGEEYYEDVREN